ncbi:glycosyltransferase family 1 protein [Soonwooa sp.]|uniref:glycosyltransferase family 4 protein n=1 Tax=Soonwooa sp. TaxID=1938592 RepID=UPI00289DDA69|nr:glycosyltransferase family 1 protein [Soonwooa sp.]
MKIAYDAKRFFNNTSGLGNYSRDLVRMLSEFFPENKYVLLAKRENERGKAILENPSVSFSPISKGNMARQFKMGKDAQNLGVDIFHGLSGELPLKWNKKPIQKIVTIHDLIFVHYPKFYSFFDRKIHFWKFKKAAHSADKIIAISEQTKKDVIEMLKVPAEKVVVVYQGCHAAFKTEKSQEELNTVKSKYNLPERFVLNVGTIEERKNLFTVIKALQHTDIPLVVVGRKTKYADQILNFIKKENMEAQVQFLEGVSMEELACIYQMADIFVYPSLFEGFGIPVIEAHFSKTAVITSNLSCLPEAGGKDAVYVNPLNVKDIKAKISFLWDNESERQRRAEKSYEFALANFSDEKVASDVMKVYHEVLLSK